MNSFKLKVLTAWAVMLSMTAVVPASYAQQYERVYDASAHRYVYVKKSPGERFIGGVKKAWKNPVVKKGTIGAGVGLGAAAVRDGNLLKGGLVGAGVGAGWGAMDKSSTMQRKPLLRHVSKGALAGAGTGVIMGGLGVLPGAAIGAGAGAVTHYIKKH